MHTKKVVITLGNNMVNWLIDQPEFVNAVLVHALGYTAANHDHLGQAETSTAGTYTLNMAVNKTMPSHKCGTGVHTQH